MDTFTYVLTTNGLLFFVSILFWKFPPKKINKLYGYRTYRTMQNNSIWNFANTTFNKTLVVYAGISFLAGLLFASFTKGVLSWEPMFLVMLTLLVCIIKTEKSISKLYDNEGRKLKPKKQPKKKQKHFYQEQKLQRQTPYNVCQTSVLFLLEKRACY